jgi:hypothetical protein
MSLFSLSYQTNTSSCSLSRVFSLFYLSELNLYGTRLFMGNVKFKGVYGSRISNTSARRAFGSIPGKTPQSLLPEPFRPSSVQPPTLFIEASQGAHVTSDKGLTLVNTRLAALGATWQHQRSDSTMQRFQRMFHDTRALCKRQCFSDT